MSITQDIHVHDDVYIGGRFQRSASARRIAVVNPATETVVAEIPEGNVADVDAAVEAAHRALPKWAATSPADRATVLRALQAALQRDASALADTIVNELGMPADATLDVQVNEAALFLGSFADAVEDLPWREQIANTVVVREPVGVVAVITPWNYPLYQLLAKAGAALAAGCTVVLKPSEIAPLNAYGLGRAARDAQLPPGVLNIVMGTGKTVGEALVLHPLVSMVGFTGSTSAGRRVAELAARTPKPASLELGGKSATIVLDDAALDVVVPKAVADCFRNSGQTCSARTRLLVPRHLADRVSEIAAAAAGATRLGPPTIPGSHLGPVVSAAQRDKIRQYIELGVAEGARLVCGGPEQPAELPQGFYIKPTVFDQVTNDMIIAQDEIFGPVLVIIAYDGEADAIAQANNSRYGLSGAVWSADQQRATDVAHQLDTGEVYINGGAFNRNAPFGGVKESGYGRELGPAGILEFTRVKSLHT
jgi:acyl-CoA reductase-like NAD-dependent aldehyde dehydrogenase